MRAATSIGALLCSLASSIAAMAAPGEFDRSFGENGIFRLAGGEFAGVGSSALFVTTDAFGNALATGIAARREAVVKLGAGGELDSGFGVSGLLASQSDLIWTYWGVAAIGLGNGQALLVQASKAACFGPGAGACAMVLPGTGVRRIHADGTVDTSYRSTGPLPSSEYGRGPSVAVQPDGAVVLAGHEIFVFGGNEVARLDSSGRADSAFNAAARTSLACRGVPSSAAVDASILRQADGRIVVAQSFSLRRMSPSPGIGSYICFTRLNEDGTQDPSYGIQGQLLLDSLLFATAPSRLVALLPRPGGGTALVIQLDHEPPARSRYHYVVALLTPDGLLDASTFTRGIAGPTAMHVGRVTAAAVQPDGMILVAGYPGLDRDVSSLGYDPSQPRVGRIYPETGADLTFGTLGTGHVPLLSFGKRLAPAHLHVAADGSVFVAGALGEAGPVNQNESTQFAVAKLRGNDPPPESRSGLWGWGCGSTSKAPFDPVLPGLVLAALLLLGSRARQGRRNGSSLPSESDGAGMASILASVGAMSATSTRSSTRAAATHRGP